MKTDEKTNEEVIEENIEENEEIAKNPEDIIKYYSLIAMVGGAVPLPLVDIVTVTGVQIKMIAKLSLYYEIHFDENLVKSYITAILGVLITKNLSRSIAGSAIKIIPYFGTFLGTLTMPVLSGGATYAIGQVFNKHFESGGTLLNFNFKTYKKFFNKEMEKGSEFVKEKINKNKKNE